MDRCSFSIALFLTVVALAMVTCFMEEDEDFGQDLGLGQGDFFNNRRFQSWMEKRGLGGDTYRFGGRLGDTRHLMNWRDYFAANGGLIKRQLMSYGPRSFGNFQRPFSTGFQDWRSTFDSGMVKREAQQQPQQQQQEKPAS